MQKMCDITIQENKKERTMKRKIFVTVLTAMLLMCVCAFSGCSGSSVTIDLKDYVSVRFEGFNGSGTARVDIDSDAMLPLIKSNDNYTAHTIADDFDAANIENNGKLSNGDTVKVKITYNEQMMKNAKITVKNPEFTFSVAGLKEKEKLDVFANVEFETVGTSPECSVTVKYNGNQSNIMFDIKNELGEAIKQNTLGGTYGGQFKNGEKLTLNLADSSLEKLREEYEIMETSREYTVQSDSKYILTAAELTTENRKELDKAAEKFLNEKIEALLNDTDRDARIRLLSAVSGVNVGSLYAGCTWRITLQPAALNSAYVGLRETVNYGKTQQFKCIYYIYEADIEYYIKQLLDVYEDETTCALIVQIDDPMITPEGVMYSKMSVVSAKDFNSAYSGYITSKFEKLP